MDTLNLIVPCGSVFAFIGRNGAWQNHDHPHDPGASGAWMRGLSRILGHDSGALPPEARARIGYIAEGHPVYGWMRVGQYAGFFNADFTEVEPRTLSPASLTTSRSTLAQRPAICRTGSVQASTWP